MAFPFSIALCCNGPMLPGLHATLASLTRSLGQREKVALSIFVSGMAAIDQEAIRQTVVDAGSVGDLQVREADVSDFKELRSLHGDHTTYLRLKLPDLLPDAAKILYLDSDLVVHTDVCEMFETPLEGASVGAILSDLVEWNLDRDVYEKFGLVKEDRCFNAGVLLLDADAWRRQGTVQRTMDFAREHSWVLKSHDQNVLNIFFSKTFYAFPVRFNRLLSTTTDRQEADNTIYHFAGSPKPWDPLGWLLHKNVHLWSDVIVTTPFRWTGFLQRYGSSYAKRTWSIHRSYGRVIYRRLRWHLWRKYFRK